MANQFRSVAYSSFKEKNRERKDFYLLFSFILFLGLPSGRRAFSGWRNQPSSIAPPVILHTNPLVEWIPPPASLEKEDRFQQDCEHQCPTSHWVGKLFSGWLHIIMHRSNSDSKKERHQQHRFSFKNRMNTTPSQDAVSSLFKYQPRVSFKVCEPTDWEIFFEHIIYKWWSCVTTHVNKWQQCSIHTALENQYYAATEDLLHKNIY